MANITFSGSRVTISGPYKEFVCAASAASVITFASGDSPVSGDVGRFLLWVRGGVSDTSVWQIRRITAVSGADVTVHDPFTATPQAGDTFRVSTSLDDLVSAQPSAVIKTGVQSFSIAGDFGLANGAFFAAADQSLDMQVTGGSGVYCPMQNGTALQLGVLWGGEGSNAQETTNGCRLSLVKPTGAGMASVFTTNNARNPAAGVVNIYGSSVFTSQGQQSITSNFIFVRPNSAARFIGCLFDGVMGGRFYHEASEWVDCRMSGIDEGTPAWSLGATFLRPIENVTFYQNLVATKNFGAFGGRYKDCVFSDSNTYVINASATTGGVSVTEYVDCTEFDASKVLGLPPGGTLKQFRSVNFVLNDADGSPLPGAVVGVTDVNYTVQGAAQIAGAQGVCGEILAQRFFWEDGGGMQAGAPFLIRIRSYGTVWASFASDIADPIRQSYNLLSESLVTQDSAVAAAHTGITLTDHGASPVAWQALDWSITITCDTSVNPSLTIEDVQHHLHYHLSRAAAFSGRASGLLWHNMLPFGGAETRRGTYGSDPKGVRIVDQAGNAFTGVTRMQSDSGAYYVPPVVITYVIAYPNFIDGTRYQVFNVTQDAEIANAVVSGGAGLSVTLTLGADYAANDVIRIRATEATKMDFEATFQPTALAGAVSSPASQVEDGIYAALGIDGSLVTKFAADYVDTEIDIVVGTDFTLDELYAWYKHNSTTENGIRLFFGAVTALDQANFVIDITKANMRFDNVTTAYVLQTDVRRISRSDGQYPVKRPTTGGGGIDIKWQQPVLIAETGVSGLTGPESAALAQIAGVKERTDNLPDDPASATGVRNAALL